MEAPDATAGSSPAPLDSSDYLESLSDSERTAFFESTPEQRAARMAKPETAKPSKAKAPTPTDADAESSPAQPVEQAASTDASPEAASEPAAPAKETKGLDAREKQIRERQAALREQLAETDRLERELADRQARLNTPKPDAPTESSPAAQKRVFEQYKNDPNAPKLDAVDASGNPIYTDYNDWAIDMMAHITADTLDKRETQAQQRLDQQRKETELHTAVETSKQRVKAFQEKNPDFAERVNPKLLDLVPMSALRDGDPQGPHNFIAEQMWRSEYPAEFALHFSEHPEDFQALMEMPDPAAIVRRMGRIEARFGEQPDGQSRETKPVPKTIPDDDELPAVIGRKAPITATGTETALKSKDFAAYEREWKRERGIKD